MNRMVWEYHLVAWVCQNDSLSVKWPVNPAMVRKVLREREPTALGYNIPEDAVERVESDNILFKDDSDED